MDDESRYSSRSKSSDNDVFTALLLGAAIALVAVFGFKSWMLDLKVEALREQNDAYRQGVVEGQIR